MAQRAKALLVLLVLLSILFSVLGCQTPAGRTPGQVVDDATITTKVKAKIFRDSILKGFAISVKTFEGTVTLIGAVDTERARKRAEALARSTSGVRNVNNLIKLK